MNHMHDVYHICCFRKHLLFYQRIVYKITSLILYIQSPTRDVRTTCNGFKNLKKIVFESLRKIVKKLNKSKITTNLRAKQVSLNRNTLSASAPFNVNDVRPLSPLSSIRGGVRTTLYSVLYDRVMSINHNIFAEKLSRKPCTWLHTVTECTGRRCDLSTRTFGPPPPPPAASVRLFRSAGNDK